MDDSDLDAESGSVPESDRPNPLGPYYPSEVPRIPGEGRRWLGLLVALAFVLWVLATLWELLLVGT